MQVVVTVRGKAQEERSNLHKQLGEKANVTIFTVSISHSNSAKASREAVTFLSQDPCKG